ncbi:MAG: hypothetical protein PHQ43_05985 [Dehalococcoidales bacterium]|nr:hypothetical protein [Dehalococcoidales bacterium]
MADKKITQLDALTSAASTDILPIVDDPGGAPQTKKITLGNVVSSLKATGAEIDAGTDDAKIVTPKAIADSKVVTEDGTQTLTNKIITMGDSMPSTNVRCIVGDLDGNINLDGNGKTIVFTTKEDDPGSNYSTSTGQFSVPITGLYLVTVLLRLNDFTAGDILIFKIMGTSQPYIINDEAKARGYSIYFSQIVKADYGSSLYVFAANSTADRGYIRDVSFGYNQMGIHLLST